MHVMNTVFFFFPSQTFFCLRRSGFVIGVRGNGLGARQNFLYAGKTLYIHTHLRVYSSKTKELTRGQGQSREDRIGLEKRKKTTYLLTFGLYVTN